MKTALKKSILPILLLLSTACSRNDQRTETFKIEQLRSEEAVKIIAKSLSQISGIQEIKPDLQKHELTIIFNGLDAHIKNIEYAIVKDGFDLPNWPANPADKAKLPEDLR